MTLQGTRGTLYYVLLDLCSKELLKEYHQLSMKKIETRNKQKSGNKFETLLHEEEELPKDFMMNIIRDVCKSFIHVIILAGGHFIWCLQGNNKILQENLPMLVSAEYEPMMDSITGKIYNILKNNRSQFPRYKTEIGLDEEGSKNGSVTKLLDCNVNNASATFDRICKQMIMSDIVEHHHLFSQKTMDVIASEKKPKTLAKVCLVCFEGCFSH